ncbi:uroporphyrin-III C-methyltransferase/precorrin-2 dehydrogenase/sirohydrochlorin ferrochelatase [Sphingomonas naasensis]|uniref:precorrin-2 dehydrogenase n=1 Tax=Sphingomonas naasensis TaxID=1344951 RepID=A0A4S1WHQ6_9SPHN|nr:NAD(P)-dependent oxidoreductase [Sphingomonas naasensis]NIJ22143.1 uroporphyrin-III C-methyltransferase/precorrin-2 dehydrogenase/sirohydrochlorin ferrochelatase [Sphingomonas naasensis]TGX42193.1 siroheme synthase [Sphingomonas naasensis]
MSLAALPIFVKLAGRPVILIGTGEIADAKRRLLERAGARVVDEAAAAALAIVAVEAPEPIVVRLRARGVLVNTVDRPDLCDFTLPAIVDRDPVLVAVGTGGVSAGLAAALRQRLEVVLPVGLGGLARALAAAKPAIRRRWPESGARRRALGAALAGPLDPLWEHEEDAVATWLADAAEPAPALLRFALASGDPDDLSLRQARALAQAERVYHRPEVPNAILDRARADAARIACEAAPAASGTGLSVYLEMAR